MAKIGFLSHSDMSIYLFRRPVMRALSELGHEVFAICPAGKYSNLIKNEFKCVNYELDRASLNPFKIISNTKKLAQILKPLKLDLLQTSAHKSNIFGTLAAKKAGIKNVINLVEGLGSFYVDSDFKSLAIRQILQSLYQICFKFSRCCIFVNQADCDFMVKNALIKKEKAFVIKSVGVNTSKFDEDAINGANLGDKKIVLMVARAILHKGVREFYEAARILSHRNDTKFVFVGGLDSGNKSAISREFLDSEFVEYLGERDDVAEILKSSHILALPSYKEGFPVSVLEAMSVGRAVVASDVTGCNEAVIDNFNGLLCEVKNPKDLAKKIEILLDDDNLRQRLGKNGKELARTEFDEVKIAQKYLEIYRKFCDV